MKKCTKCKQYKELTFFGKDKSRKDGYSYKCLDCNKTESRQMDKKHLDRKRKYYYKNREELIKKKVAYNDARYKTNVLYKLEQSCRKRLRRAVKLNKKIGSISNLIGCTSEYLKKHLSEMFDENMSWENYGTYWHIDHIKPCASFDLSIPSEISACFHYSNLQPLSAHENLKKGKRYINA